MAIVFDQALKCILIEAPQVEIDIQTLHNAIAERMSKPDFMVVPPADSGFTTIHSTTGKQALFGGVLVGLTLELFDDWRLQFQDRPGPTTISCTISGGNLTTTNSFSDNPIKPSTFTQVVTTQSSSATLIDLPLLENIKHLLEAQSPHRQKGYGTTFYISPTLGDDGQDGLKPISPVKTFVQALSLVTAGRGDVIVVLNDNASGTTLINETVVVNKASTIIRGAGAGILVQPATDTNPTFLIDAAGVEISSLEVRTAGTGSQNAITVSANGNRFSLNDVVIRSPRGHGILTNNTGPSQNYIRDCVVAGASQAGKAGIRIVGTPYVEISNTQVHDCQFGIEFAGALASRSLVTSSFIEDCVRGIEVAAGVTGVMVRGNVAFHDNTLAFSDLGGGSYCEQYDGKSVEGNTQREFILAVVDTAVGTRNVGAGKLDRVIFRTKHHSDPDWTTPISLYTLYAWYTTLGDDNPLRIGEP